MSAFDELVQTVAELAPFVGERQTLSKQMLDEWSDWVHPPIIAGDSHFSLTGPLEDESELIQIEVRGHATLLIEDVRARVVAREHAQVFAEGEGITIWAFDQAHAGAEQEATVRAFDQADVFASSSVVLAVGRARVEAFGFTEVTAIDQTRVEAGGAGLYSITSGATVKIGKEAGPPNPMLAAMAGGVIGHLATYPTVVVAGGAVDLGAGLTNLLPRSTIGGKRPPSRVIADASSDPCALVLHDDTVDLTTDGVREGWWEQTLKRTEESLANSSHQDHREAALARLRAARARLDTSWIEAERLANLRIEPQPPGRRPGLAE